MFRFFLIIILSFFFISEIFSQKNHIIISNLDEKYILDFYFQEVDNTDGYVANYNINNLKILDHKSVLPDKTIDSSIFVLRSFFKIDNSILKNEFGLHIGPINYPCKIFLNGNLIFSLGQLGENPTTKIQFSSNVFFPPVLLKKDTINEICFQAYTKKEDKTSLGKIFISSTKTVETYTFFRNLLREDIVQAAMWFSLILSIYFIFGFLLKKDKSDRKYIYFALFCFGFSIGYSNLGLSFNFIDDIILYKITRMGIPFASIMLVAYTLEFTQLIKKRKSLIYILSIPIIIVEIIYFIQNDLSGIEKTMSKFSAYINLPYMFFCFILSIFAFIRNKRKSHFSFVLGFVILFVAITHDTYYYFINIIAYTWYVPHAFLFLIITTFFILASEQTQIYHISIARRDELQKIKENLEDIVQKRTEQVNNQNRELSKQSKDLQEMNSLLVKTNAEVLQQKEELMAQTENLKNANSEITKQKDLIEKSHNEIKASINYACRIQNGLLPNDSSFKDTFKDFFIFYKPKDVVSGDFYFFKKIKNWAIVVIADCTGHGVPGAFMSILGISFLNEIVTRKDISQANQVLEELRKQIKKALNQKGDIDEQKDGMDLALCAYNQQDNVLQYSGANNSIFLFQNNLLTEYKSVRNPIGIYLKEKEFENHIIKLNNGDIFYMFTDGIFDQFGGEQGRKLRKGNFKKIILEILNKPMIDQKNYIENTLLKWQNNQFAQTDDITVAAFKI